jgi:hypothetical protein
MRAQMAGVNAAFLVKDVEELTHAQPDTIAATIVLVALVIMLVMPASGTRRSLAPPPRERVLARRGRAPQARAPRQALAPRARGQAPPRARAQAPPRARAQPPPRTRAQATCAKKTEITAVIRGEAMIVSQAIARKALSAAISSATLQLVLQSMDPLFH